MTSSGSPLFHLPVGFSLREHKWQSHNDYGASNDGKLLELLGSAFLFHSFRATMSLRLIHAETLRIPHAREFQDWSWNTVMVTAFPSDDTTSIRCWAVSPKINRAVKLALEVQGIRGRGVVVDMHRLWPHTKLYSI